MLGPRNKSEKEIFAIEGFRVDVQYEIQKFMGKKGITQDKLARLLNIPIKKVEDIFSDECNIDIRMLARIFHVLGAKLSIKLEV